MRLPVSGQDTSDETQRVERVRRSGWGEESREEDRRRQRLSSLLNGQEERQMRFLGDAEDVEDAGKLRRRVKWQESPQDSDCVEVVNAKAAYETLDALCCALAQQHRPYAVKEVLDGGVEVCIVLLGQHRAVHRL